MADLPQTPQTPRRTPTTIAWDALVPEPTTPVAPSGQTTTPPAQAPTPAPVSRQPGTHPQWGNLIAEPPPSDGRPIQYADKPDPNTVAAKIHLDDILTGAFEIVGAVVGSKLAPFKTLGAIPRVVSAAVSSGAGAAAGVAVGRPASTLLPGGPPPSLDFRPDEIGRAAVAGTTGELGARAATGAWQLTKWGISKAPEVAARAGMPRVAAAAERVRTPFGGKLEPPSAKAEELWPGQLRSPAVEAHQRGLRPTIAQATTSRFAQISENIAQNAFIGGGKYAKVLDENSLALRQELMKELGSFGPPGVLRTAEQRGLRIQAARQGAERVERNAANAIYEQQVWPVADKLGVSVSLAPVRQYAEDELAKRGLAVDFGGKGVRLLKKLSGEAEDAGTVMAKRALTASSGRSGAQQLGDDLFNNPKYAAVAAQIFGRAGLPVMALHADDIPFRAAHYLRSAANDLAREAGKSGDYESAYLARQIYGRLDESMELAANAADPGLAKAYTEATTKWREMRTKFDGTVLDAVASAEPRAVVDAIIKPHRVKDIVEARDTIGPRGWREVQRSVAEKLVENPTKILDEIKKLGPETLNAVFPGTGGVPTYHGIAQLGRIIEMYQKKGIGTGQVWIELAQAGAAAGIVFNRAPGKGAGILLTPVILSRILTNPTARQWLTTGLREGLNEMADPTTKTRVAAQLLSWVRSEQASEDQAQPKPGPPPAVSGASGGRGGGPGPIGSAPPAGVPRGLSPVPLGPVRASGAGGVGQPPPPVRRDR